MEMYKICNLNHRRQGKKTGNIGGKCKEQKTISKIVVFNPSILISILKVNGQNSLVKTQILGAFGGGVKMAEEQDGEITFSSTNSSKEQNGEQSLQNNF